MSLTSYRAAPPRVTTCTASRGQSARVARPLPSPLGRRRHHCPTHRWWFP